MIDGDGTDNGGSETSSTTTVTISVTNLNDIPTISGLDGESLTVAEGDIATLLDTNSASSVADVDSTDFDGGTLTLSLASGTTSDAFSISLGVLYQVTGSGTDGDPYAMLKTTDITTAVATYVEVDGSSDFTVSLSTSSDVNLVTDILQGIKFTNSSDNPSTDERILSITLTDGDGGTSATSSLVLQLPVNDVPTVDDISDPAAIDEDTLGDQTISLSGISAGGGESQTITITATPDDSSLFDTQPTVTYTSPEATGTITYSLAANASGSTEVTLLLSLMMVEQKMVACIL